METPLAAAPAPTAATRGGDANPLAREDGQRHFAGQRLAAPGPHDLVAAAASRRPSGGTEGLRGAALGEERELGGSEELELADDAVATALRAGTAGARAQGVAHDTDRQLRLQRFDRGIHGVRH